MDAYENPGINWKSIIFISMEDVEVLGFIPGCVNNLPILEGQVDFSIFI